MGESSSGVISDDAKWQRYGYLAGVVFVVLAVASTFVPGTPPDRDASSVDIGNYFMENDSGIRLAAILFGFALIFAVWWLGSLWRVISRLEANGPRLALIGAAAFIASGAVAAVSQAVFTVPATRGEDLIGTADFVWSLGFTLYGFGLALIATHMLALAALTLRSGFLPKWMGYLALLSGVVAAVGVIAAGSEEAVFGLIGFVGFLTWLLWTLLAGVLLYRGKKA